MRQTLILGYRNMLNNTRDVGIFWVHLVMYAMLCICLGFVFFQLDHSWYAPACSCLMTLFGPCIDAMIQAFAAYEIMQLSYICGHAYEIIAVLQSS